VRVNWRRGSWHASLPLSFFLTLALADPAGLEDEDAPARMDRRAAVPAGRRQGGVPPETAVCREKRPRNMSECVRGEKGARARRKGKMSKRDRARERATDRSRDTS
jgi:hypothetical protein